MRRIAYAMWEPSNGAIAVDEKNFKFAGTSRSAPWQNGWHGIGLTLGEYAGGSWLTRREVETP
jgi:hypothetical protein